MAFPFYDYVEVRKLRKASGLTQQELADAIKKDRTTVARFETGAAASLELLVEYTTHFKRDYRDFLLAAHESTA